MKFKLSSGLIEKVTDSVGASPCYSDASPRNCAVPWIMTLPPFVLLFLKDRNDDEVYVLSLLIMMSPPRSIRSTTEMPNNVIASTA